MIYRALKKGIISNWRPKTTVFFSPLLLNYNVLLPSVAKSPLCFCPCFSLSLCFDGLRLADELAKFDPQSDLDPDEEPG